MTTTDRAITSPLVQALKVTVFVAAFGLVVRYAWGAFDPEMRGWSLVAVAPFAGAVTYLTASGRARAFAWLLAGMGAAGLVFWSVILWSGAMPVTTRIEWAYVAGIFAFPLAALLGGVHLLRKLRAARISESAK